MRSFSLVKVVSALAVAIVAAACGSSSTSPADPSAEATAGAAGTETRAAAKQCPVPEGVTPPPCPEGCDWNGEFCEDKRGVIIVDARDGGADASQ